MWLWAEVQPAAGLVERTFRILGTGHNMPEGVPLAYVGTVQQPPFVWHVYEEESLGAHLARTMF